MIKSDIFLKKVNKLEKQISELSDEDLKRKTSEYKQLLEEGKSTKTFEAEAFAVVREVTKRITKKRLYDVQIMAGYVLAQGNIAEIKAGEGKTLIAVLPTYINALDGKGVHVITTNEYLAKRDYEEIGPILEFLGITVGLIYQGMSIKDKKEAYKKDVTYGNNTEFGFDYLRDNLVKNKKFIVQRSLNFALIDEADSILLDEATTPLVIARSKRLRNESLYKKVDKFVKGLSYKTIVKEKVKNNQDQYEYLKDADYYIDESTKNAFLTEKGIANVEKEFKLKNLYSSFNNEFLSILMQSLRANGAIKKDVDYIIQNNEIKIIDKFTGRIMKNKRYNDGLHEAIEAKENLLIGFKSEVVGTIACQNFFKLYNKLSGMTGTAYTSKTEFLNIYGMDVIKIPTNKKVQRIDYNNRFFKTEKEKFEAVAEEIQETIKKKQPVLIGTASIEKSEMLCNILDNHHITYNLLNAKNDAKEAEIVKNAGEPRTVTISTNMAGRGTNIIINKEVASYGGLKVIGTEMYEASRIDEQLRGRAGRQGEVGESILFLSLEDDLVKLYGNKTKIENYKKRFSKIPQQNIEKEFEKAQHNCENLSYTYRKNIIEFDNIIGVNRNNIYKYRSQILNAQGDKVFYSFLKDFCEFVTKSDDIFANNILIELNSHTATQLEEKILKKYNKKKKELGEKEFEKIEKNIQLNIFDQNWMEYLNNMNIVLDNIYLSAYAGHNPIEKFAVISKKAFDELCDKIKLDIITNIIFGVDYDKCVAQ